MDRLEEREDDEREREDLRQRADSLRESIELERRT
jgi:hypothetical protein